MKKVVILSIVVLFVLMSVFACGSTKSCPAYGKNITEQTDKHNG